MRGLRTAGMLVLVAGIGAGCGEWVQINSVPRDAKCYINGTLRGATPVRTVVDSWALGPETRVRLEKKGYEDFNGILEKRVRGMPPLFYSRRVRGEYCFELQAKEGQASEERAETPALASDGIGPAQAGGTPLPGEGTNETVAADKKGRGPLRRRARSPANDRVSASVGFGGLVGRLAPGNDLESNGGWGPKVFAEIHYQTKQGPAHSFLVGLRTTDYPGCIDLWDNTEVFALYRRYLGLPSGRRFFCEAGIGSAWREGDPTAATYTGEEWSDPGNPVLGAGVRLRPLDGRSPWFADVSVGLTLDLEARDSGTSLNKTETRLALVFGRTIGWGEANWPAAAARPSSTTGRICSAGPRMGLVVVTGKAADDLKAAYDANPVLTAWGWQFEWQYETSLGGPSGLVEFVPLVLGTEQGLTIPTANLLFGIRTAGDKEFAVGPNVTGNGVGLTVAVGKTFRPGGMSLPVNFAIVSGADGVRTSITVGWNLRQQ